MKLGSERTTGFFKIYMSQTDDLLSLTLKKFHPLKTGLRLHINYLLDQIMAQCPNWLCSPMKGNWEEEQNKCSIL